jgi:putative PIN family toxin of toxin-antitoxin system
MVIVMDTNVLYQALKSRSGASSFILSLIRHNALTLALSVPVFKEYEMVLTRPGFLKETGLSVDDIEKILRFIAYVARPYSTWFLFRPNLEDENDNMFVELAIASSSDYLITSNTKDFTTKAELSFQELSIVTSAEFVQQWRNKDEN